MNDYPKEQTIGKKTILIIEDDKDMNELIRVILEKTGYLVESALDWKGAYKIMEELHPDLILLDFMLPDANGGEICRNISKNERLKGIPVIMISSLRELPIKLESLVAGAVRFINKPFTIEELTNEVERAIKKRQSSPSIWDDISSLTKD
jgi:DNA-binding response OmpR family regulator